MASKSYEKLVEDISKMSVLELSELVKALETTFGVSAAMPVAAAPAAQADAGAAKAEEKSSYKVKLVEATDKIKAIKALRQVLPNLGLGDAKAAVEALPYAVGEMPKADAEKAKKTLEEAGAKVELA
ncbi:MAG TPA: 50S ribosomal protein L7/L12 [Candidatus Babeliales bacterium]|nr:50S ribosomal protein L7/L12 [Candidatus Babeliales bacterium]